MFKHLLVAGACLGTAVLLGGSATIGQLWVKSSSDDERITRLQADVKEAESALRKANSALRVSQQKQAEVTEQFASAERDLKLEEADQRELRKQLLQLEAQIDALRQAADDAVAYSERVVELERRLNTLQNGAAIDNQVVQAGATMDDLVEVRKRTGEKTESAAAGKSDSAGLETTVTTQQYDDTGWKSVAPTSMAYAPNIP